MSIAAIARPNHPNLLAAVFKTFFIPDIIAVQFPSFIAPTTAAIPPTIPTASLTTAQKQSAISDGLILPVVPQWV